MTAADGSPPWLDDGAELADDSDARLRRYLESIAYGKKDADPAAARGTGRTEARVSRFAWSCEELDVCFGEIDPHDPETLTLVIEQGIAKTLVDIRAKADSLLQHISRAAPVAELDTD
jgi:hypothetical protein